MVDSLADYARRMLEAGYSADQVRQQLASAGYDQAAIAAALEGSGMSRPTRTTSITPLTVGFGLAALLVIVVGSILLIGALAPKPVQVLLSSKASSAEAVLGGTASFTTRLQNPDGRKTVVELAAELVENSTGKVVATATQQLSLREAASPLLRFDVPADAAPGAYHARIVAAWDGKSATVLPGVILLTPAEAPPPPSPQEEVLADCPTGCDDFNKCTLDSCSEGQCVHEPQVPCCGNRACEDGETEVTCIEDCRRRTGSERPAYELQAEAVQAAAEDPSKAQELCGRIAVAAYADECYATIAPQAGFEACTNILDSDTRDGCIIDFAAADPARCKLIQGRALRTSCYSIARLQSAQPPPGVEG